MDKQLEQLVTANTEILDQLLSLIEKTPEIAYNKVADGMTSNVGSHIRHVLDHYITLQIGIASAEIDYDRRSRGSDMEKKPASATKYILELKDWLKENIAKDIQLKIKTEISVLNKQQLSIDSSLKRELIYLLNHTVHHMAQISSALRIMRIPIESHIGVAPATSTFLRVSN